MSYLFHPLSDQELSAIAIVDEGVYDFEIVKSTRKVSKAGNPMGELLIQFWDKQGQVHTIFDYLVFSQVPLNIRKIKHFCAAVGLINAYERGEIPEALERYVGSFKLGIEEERPKPDGGMYPKKNIVLDYIPTEKTSLEKLSDKILKHTEDELNDDIPF